MTDRVRIGVSVTIFDSVSEGDDYQLNNLCMIQPKIPAGAAFDQDVFEFLRCLCLEQQRDRSIIINAIVREYAQRHESRQKPPEPAIHS